MFLISFQVGAQMRPQVDVTKVMHHHRLKGQPLLTFDLLLSLLLLLLLLLLSSSLSSSSLLLSLSLILSQGFCACLTLVILNSQKPRKVANERANHKVASWMNWAPSMRFVTISII